MDRYKNLTHNQCLRIAELINPNVEWVYTICKEYPWEGHDIVSKEVIDNIYSNIIQISYNGEISYWEELDGCVITSEEYEKVNKLIDSF